MNREFTRSALYDLVWSQPMKTVAANVGISDVALAKQCKKANIPVPTRGYRAQKQAGRPTSQIALPPRFPGASDRVGGTPLGLRPCNHTPTPHRHRFQHLKNEAFEDDPNDANANKRAQHHTRVWKFGGVENDFT